MTRKTLHQRNYRAQGLSCECERPAPARPVLPLTLSARLPLPSSLAPATSSRSLTFPALRIAAQCNHQVFSCHQSRQFRFPRHHPR